MNKSFWSIRCPSLNEFKLFSPNQVSFFESLVDESGYPSSFLNALLGRDINSIVNPSYINSFSLNMNKLGYEIQLKIIPVDKSLEGRLSIQGIYKTNEEWGSLWYCIEKLEEWWNKMNE